MPVIDLFRIPELPAATLLFFPFLVEFLYSDSDQGTIGPQPAISANLLAIRQLYLEKLFPESSKDYKKEYKQKLLVDDGFWRSPTASLGLTALLEQVCGAVEPLAALTARCSYCW